jgi:ATP-binding cassette subfamily C protein
VRGRILTRVGAVVDEGLSRPVFDIVVRMPLRARVAGDGLQPLRDLDSVRGFLSGLGPTALFDLPWMPLYIAICFLFHPMIGWTALAGALILVVVTLATETSTKANAREAANLIGRRNALAEAGRRNAEALRAMGMARRYGRIWGEANDSYMDAHRRTADISNGFGSFSKILRMALQSLVLGIGAYLVIQQQATAGIMIAASILTARALAPVELAIANWKGFVGARQGWARLRELLARTAEPDETMRLPRPETSFALSGASSAPPGARKLTVTDITFTLKAGNGLGVIGPTASGKSSLARMIVGVWPVLRGSVRLDGATLDQWDAELLGEHIGYLPQDVELFAGTLSENIARFEPDPDPERIIAAARAADVHELILLLPEGYDTQIGEGGAVLSVGQRQRIGLARALYGDPFLVVLDEPNANLDQDGEQALTKAILGVRKRGGIVIVIAHRPSALAGVDLILVMADGGMKGFGPRDEVLSKILRPVQGDGPAQAANQAQGSGRTGSQPMGSVAPVRPAQEVGFAR